MARSLLSLKSLTINSIRLASGTSQTAGIVKTPIPIFGIDGRYVMALWSAASKHKKLDAVDAELKKILELTQRGKPSFDTKFAEFLFNPLIKAKEKKEILSQTSLKLSEVTLNLIGVMSEMGRLKMLPSVARGFNRMMSVSKNEMDVTVTTANAVDDSTKKEIEQSLNGFVKGAKLSMTIKVDPRILGGIIVDFGGEHYIDMSIRSKFNFYQNLIKQAV